MNAIHERFDGEARRCGDTNNHLESSEFSTHTATTARLARIPKAKSHVSAEPTTPAYEYVAGFDNGAHTGAAHPSDGDRAKVPCGPAVTNKTERPSLMKNQAITAALLAFASLVHAPSQALTIEFIPAIVTAHVGDTIRIDVVTHDVMPGTSPVIGDFDIYTRFTASILLSTIEALPTDTVFGPALGRPGHETTAIWGVYEDTAPDVVRIAEFSVLPASSLEALQSTNNFRLGSLFFDALSDGVARLDFTSASLGGAGLTVGSAYQGIGPRLDFAIGPSATITIIPVPEPSTFFLLTACALALFTSRSAIRLRGYVSKCADVS